MFGASRRCEDFDNDVLNPVKITFFDKGFLIWGSPTHVSLTFWPNQNCQNCVSCNHVLIFRQSEDRFETPPKREELH